MRLVRHCDAQVAKLPSAIRAEPIHPRHHHNRVRARSNWASLIGRVSMYVVSCRIDAVAFAPRPNGLAPVRPPLHQDNGRLRSIVHAWLSFFQRQRHRVSELVRKTAPNVEGAYEAPLVSARISSRTQLGLSSRA